MKTKEIALHFTSKYGLQTQEFDQFLNSNNITFKKRVGNIFIPSSKEADYTMYVDNRTKKAIFKFLSVNRLAHIEKTGEYTLDVVD